MRNDGRKVDEIRPVTIETGWKKQADGSALYRAGGTVVLCVASVDEGVKDFLRGKSQGWVTAEYVMHPRAGTRRQTRDGFNGRSLSGRSHEIARLVGRSLRAAVDMKSLGERTITVDCDVLEADGGTRTASVTGGMVALALALDGMRRKGQITTNPLVSLVAAGCGPQVSLGSTSVVTAVSSLVETVLLKASTTEFTVTETVAVSVLPAAVVTV